MTAAEYELEAEVLRDEGYSEGEIEQLLGKPPEPEDGRVDWQSFKVKKGDPVARRLIIEALQEYAEAHEGDPPSSEKWKNTNGGANPSYSQVGTAFGFWHLGIEAAGLTIRVGRNRDAVWKPKQTKEMYDGDHLRADERVRGPLPRPRRELGLFRDGPPSLMESLDEVDAFDERIEVELGRGRNSYPAANSRRIVISRGAKIRRLAKAMCELRKLRWWEITDVQRMAFVRLAEFALEALEVVEDEVDRVGRPNTGAEV